MWPFTPKDWRDTYRTLSDGDLLNRIRNGDERASDFLMETFLPPLLNFTRILLTKQSEALGDPGDFAHDALLLLWSKAGLLGADALNNGNISTWLNTTVKFRFNNACRKEQKHRREVSINDDHDDQIESVLTRIADPGAHKFPDMPEKTVFAIVEEVLESHFPKIPPLTTLIHYRWIEMLSWKETAILMQQHYPDHKPPFEVDYLQKTYWDRIHKKPFFTLLRKALKKYGYDL